MEVISISSRNLIMKRDETGKELGLRRNGTRLGFKTLFFVTNSKYVLENL